MPTNLLLLPLLGGYWFLQHVHYFRFRANRLDGYRLLMESALCGVSFMAIAWFLILLLQRVRCFEEIRRSFFPDIPFLGTACLSLLIGLVSPHLLNFLLGATALQTAEEANYEAVMRHGNNLLRLLHTAMVREETISLTLDSRKVYIGYVTKAPNLEPHDTFVAVLPIFSGYRDKDTLSLVLTTDYLSVLSTAERNIADFVQTVPIASIRSAGIYDFTLQEKFLVEDDKVGENHEGIAACT